MTPGSFMSVGWQLDQGSMMVCWDRPLMTAVASSGSSWHLFKGFFAGFYISYVCVLVSLGFTNRWEQGGNLPQQRKYICFFFFLFLGPVILNKAGLCVPLPSGTSCSVLQPCCIRNRACYVFVLAGYQGAPVDRHYLICPAIMAALIILMGL